MSNVPAPSATSGAVFLRDLIIKALKAKPTIARDNIFSPGDTATWDGEYPKIVIRIPFERKDSVGRVAPQFTTVATISLAGQITAQTDDAAEGQLDIFADQIMRAVINDYTLTNNIQQFLFVETKKESTSEGSSPLGQVTINFGLEFYEGTEDFASIEANPIEEVAVTVDLVNIFDADGIYPNPKFPSSVTPVPRTSGPDGRPEAFFITKFPKQE